MKKVTTYKGAVMTWECDSNHHMNVMYYVNKFEHAGRSFDIELGLTNLGSGKDLGIVVVEQKINYIKEVFEDDILYIESSLEGIGTKSFTVFHEMYDAHTSKLCATMHVVLVLFDKISRKGIPFPVDKKKHLLEKLNGHDQSS